MSNSAKFAAYAACLLVSAPMAWAGPDEDPLIAQLKKIASQGQDQQTAAQVDQYVDDNKDSITAILKAYNEYLKQMQNAQGGEDPGAAKAAPQSSGPPVDDQSAAPAASSTAAAPSTTGQAATPAVVRQSTGLQTSGGLQTSSLQTSSVQPSGGLSSAHLAGYPSLPNVDPVSSITQITAEQQEYAVKVKKDNAARKQYLMAHPEGYTY